MLLCKKNFYLSDNFKTTVNMIRMMIMVVVLAWYVC